VFRVNAKRLSLHLVSTASTSGRYKHSVRWEVQPGWDGLSLEREQGPQ
jgi:hypothetical protein